MSPFGLYNDPATINAFLTNMRDEAESLANDLDGKLEIIGDADKPAKADTKESTDHGQESKTPTGTNTPVAASTTTSPHIGTRAPPPTPESLGATPVDVEHLPSINEDHNESQDQTSKVEEATNNEQSPSPKQFRPTARPFIPSPEKQDGGAVSNTPKSSSKNAFADHLQQNANVKNYREQALDRFRQQAEARIAQRGYAAHTDRVKDADLPTTNKEALAHTDPGIQTEPIILTVYDQHKSTADDTTQFTSSVITESFDNGKAESTALTEVSDDDDDDSSINIVVDGPTSPEVPKSRESAIAITVPEQSYDQADVMPNRPDFNANDAVRTIKEEIVIKAESSEDVVYFPSWGTPAPRSTGPAQVRKIVLSGLPATADLTLVQSLIHGGAIEEMQISHLTSGAQNAQVIFTDPTMCDLYYNKYPNGLEFKYRGKKHVAFVEKGRDVDVVSGVMQSYLDCGATRVVKIAGADHDWSFRALHKLAEGHTGQRKVESITDNYRNDSRTVIVRFTKIADAVTFRGQLLRSPDWDGADVRFMVDPCEKATGVHYE